MDFTPAVLEIYFEVAHKALGFDLVEDAFAIIQINIELQIYRGATDGLGLAITKKFLPPLIDFLKPAIHLATDDQDIGACAKGFCKALFRNLQRLDLGQPKPLCSLASSAAAVCLRL